MEVEALVVGLEEAAFPWTLVGLEKEDLEEVVGHNLVGVASLN